MAKKRGLGRGLDALLGNAALGSVPAYQPQESQELSQPVSQATEPDQLSEPPGENNISELPSTAQPSSVNTPSDAQSPEVHTQGESSLDIEVPDPDAFERQHQGELK